MGIFDSISGLLSALSGGSSSGSSSGSLINGAIGYGKQKADGSHDHRYNTGDDRTPAQKEGDKKNGKNSDE